MTSAATSTDLNENQLVERAQTAVSQCNWTVGECAAQWTQRFARGRTDGDFAAMVGLSADQVYQRRRVWEAFAEVREDYADLKWSHFYVALNWEDATACLDWALEIGATVAEMKAWRRAQRGEDLTIEAEEEHVSFLVDQPTLVRSPNEYSDEDRADRGDDRYRGEREAASVASGVARESDGNEAYAPFSKDARQPYSGSPEDGPAEPREPPDAEQSVRKLAVTLERCCKVLDQDVSDRFSSVPEKTRLRFLHAFEELAERVGSLE